MFSSASAANSTWMAWLYFHRSCQGHLSDVVVLSGVLVSRKTSYSDSVIASEGVESLLRVTWKLTVQLRYLDSFKTFSVRFCKV